VRFSDRDHATPFRSESDKHVCAACFDDDAIAAFIRDDAVARRCDYCGKRSKKRIAAPIDLVMELIVESLFTDFNTVADEGMIYDHEDESYTHETCKLVKHENRYMFSLAERGVGSDFVPASKMLGEIGRAIQKAGLIKLLIPGARFYRARVHAQKKHYNTSSQLGPPPARKAIYSNRMSPAGISMFYGADTKRTAIAETYRRSHQPVAITIAVFETLYPIRVVDLTRLPSEPSLFDRDKRHIRYAIRFLRGFIDDLTKPIARDEREHIEYVPTQIVTEYFRYGFEGGKRLQGLLYPSARHRGGTSCVLFFDQSQCGSGSGRHGDQCWLRLVPNSFDRVLRNPRLRQTTPT
jgi:hypothetical protein